MWETGLESLHWVFFTHPSFPSSFHWIVSISIDCTEGNTPKVLGTSNGKHEDSAGVEHICMKQLKGASDLLKNLGLFFV